MSDDGRQTAVLLYRGRTTHRFADDFEVVGNERRNRLACGKEMPFRVDHFGYKVLHRWRAWSVTERPAYNPCPICWPEAPETDGDKT